MFSGKFILPSFRCHRNGRRDHEKRIKDDHQDTRVKMTFSTKSALTLHEPIRVDCTVDNANTEPVLVDSGCILGCRGMDAQALGLIITKRKYCHPRFAA